MPEGATVIFSAHGVAPVVHEEARARSLKTIDATCPLVTKVHREAVRFADDDYDILLIGHEGHEEVVGTAGEAPEHITLVDGPDDVDNVTVRDPEKVVWLSQTTLSVDETMETVRGSRRSSPRCRARPPTTSATRRRTARLAVKQMAKDTDLMIVVGSRNSSNSVRLVEVALEHGARAGHLVDYADEIDEAWLDGVTTVGSPRGRACPRCSCATCSPGWPSAATARSSRSSPRRSRSSSRCPTSCAATIKRLSRGGGRHGAPRRRLRGRRLTALTPGRRAAPVSRRAPSTGPGSRRRPSGRAGSGPAGQAAIGSHRLGIRLRAEADDLDPHRAADPWRWLIRLVRISRDRP